jgi:YcaO cyclodehydratase, ATP-ad Mg2+-binding
VSQRGVVLTFSKEFLESIWNRGAYERLVSRPQKLMATGERLSPELVSIKPWPPEKPFIRPSFLATVRGLGFEATGIGSSDIAAMAIQKAISEAYERLVFKLLRGNLNLGTSNGMAAHPNIRAAQRNAAAELLERDALIVQWLTKTPLQNVINLPGREWQNLVDRSLAGTSFTLRNILSSTCGEISTLTLLVENKAAGVALVSHGSGGTSHHALRRTLVELERLVAVIHEILPLKPDFENVGEPLMQNAIFTPQRLLDSSWMLGEDIPLSELNKTWRSSGGKFFKEIEFQLLASGDISVCRASSAHLQDYFGSDTEKALQSHQLNWSRLEKSDINRARHFVI